MNSLLIGSLVHSDEFEGIGKIITVNIDKHSATIAFFESPANPYARQREISIDALMITALHEETVVYCQLPLSTRWVRARFGGERPNGEFLVIFREDEHAIIPISQIYVLNKDPEAPLNPAHFLAYQSNDAPFFFPRRQAFIDSYIQQRVACRGIASLSSSAVELEPHQLAVVKRVLQDEKPKYILADEVGLGKTIEAGMIIREHALEKEGRTSMLVAVPSSLIEQWVKELGDRFQLKQIITNTATALKSLLKNGCAEGIVICSHDDACLLLGKGFKPSLITIDEIHQIASWPWSNDSEEVHNFRLISEACQSSIYVLLLTGTPLHGHERNFLSMLHCINPEAYQIDEEHLQAFTELVKNRESLGGIFSALVPSVSNISLRRNLDELLMQFPSDLRLAELCQQLFPFIGRFAQPTEERKQGIQIIRRHLGENYRIHHRLLRNRRQVSQSNDESKNMNLDFLFPGLKGVLECRWQTEGLSLDEILEEYRSLSQLPDNRHWAMSEEHFLTWIDDLLSSPLCVLQRAKTALASSNIFDAEERELLEHIITTAKLELQTIDNSLAASLNDWLQQYPDGKAIIFCDRPELAQHLALKMAILLDYPQEHYQPGQTLHFVKPGSTLRVLICDRRGEDGLNLHGGRRLAVHYGLPRSCSRIEQRLGRLNRYSANLRGVKPIQSLILKNQTTFGLRNLWADVLKDSIGVFNNTIASLQFVLDEYMSNVWQKLYQEGFHVLDAAGCELPSVLTRETNKINMQEKLLAMDDEVEEADLFAQQLSAADHVAVEQCKALIPWITQGLRFRSTGTAEEGLKFHFELGSRSSATLVDFKTFLTTCMLSFDCEGGNPPSTHLMSAERIPAFDGTTVYPLRYGQPFVDAIWRLLNQDARGSSMAILRVLPASLNEPRYFFQMSWLVTYCDPLSDYAQIRKGDEYHPPYILQEWLTADGTAVTNQQFIDLLNKEYSNNESPQKSYVDLNLRPSMWQEIEELVSCDNWKEMVERVYGKSVEKLREQTGSETFLQLMAMKGVIVCSRNILAGVA